MSDPTAPTLQDFLDAWAVDTDLPADAQQSVRKALTDTSLPLATLLSKLPREIEPVLRGHTGAAKPMAVARELLAFGQDNGFVVPAPTVAPATVAAEPAAAQPIVVQVTPDRPVEQMEIAELLQLLQGDPTRAVELTQFIMMRPLVQAVMAQHGHAVAWVVPLKDGEPGINATATMAYLNSLSRGGTPTRYYGDGAERRRLVTLQAVAGGMQVEYYNPFTGGVTTGPVLDTRHKAYSVADLADRRHCAYSWARRTGHPMWPANPTSQEIVAAFEPDDDNLALPWSEVVADFEAACLDPHDIASRITRYPDVSTPRRMSPTPRPGALTPMLAGANQAEENKARAALLARVASQGRTLTVTTSSTRVYDRVVGRLVVTGHDVEVDAVVLDSAEIIGHGTSGTLYVPATAGDIVDTRNAINCTVRTVQCTYVQLAQRSGLYGNTPGGYGDLLS